MKNFAFIFLVLVAACTNSKESTDANQQSSRYPQTLEKIFKRHGSLATWQKMKSLTYEIVGDDGNEKQMIHLADRRERIEAPDFITGFDGENIWLEADSTYNGDPVFYHNLMFYFYAMPFVMADEGINYSIADTLTFEGKQFPGIKITYEANVGNSPKDEYYLHYDPETYQMTWLGYTVTYFSGEKSKDISWIRYNDWVDNSNLLMPRSMTWYKYEEEKLTEPRGTAEFDKVQISSETLPDSIFQKTAAAVVIN